MCWVLANGSHWLEVMNTDESNRVSAATSGLQLIACCWAPESLRCCWPWPPRVWGSEPPGLDFLRKTTKYDLEWGWGTCPFLGNLDYRSLHDLSPDGGPLLPPSRSACNSLSLFEREGVYISSQPFWDPAPSLAAPRFIPPPFPFFTNLSFHFKQQAALYLPYTSAQLMRWSNYTPQENGQAEYGWCASCPYSYLGCPAATLLLTTVTDDYNYGGLNYSVYQDSQMNWAPSSLTNWGPKFPERYLSSFSVLLIRGKNTVQYWGPCYLSTAD